MSHISFSKTTGGIQSCRIQFRLSATAYSFFIMKVHKVTKFHFNRFNSFCQILKSGILSSVWNLILQVEFNFSLNQISDEPITAI